MASQHDGPIEILLGVMSGLFVPEIQSTDHAAPDVQRDDHGGHAFAFLQQYAFGARQRVHADRAARADRLARHSLRDGKDRFPRDEPAAGLVIQRVEVVVLVRLIGEHDARAPEVQHALHLEDGALKNLAHVDRGVDQRAQLPHHREARRGRTEDAGMHGGAIFPRGRVELL